MKGTTAWQDDQWNTESYAAILQAHGIPFHEQGMWLMHGQPDYHDRWVICVSLTIRDAAEILDAVLPIVDALEAPFVLIKNRLQHNRINNHAFPAPLFGKPLQVFATSNESALALSQQLVQATKRFEGLHIPGMIRLGSIVYTAFSLKNPDLDCTSSVNVPFHFTTGVRPFYFPEEMIWPETQPRRFLKKRYLPISMIRSSHKGNILEGLDLQQLKWVFIKQANAWAGEDMHGRQMRDRLLWQREVAIVVNAWVRTPQPLACFDQDNYSYLVTEYCRGAPLETLIHTDNNNEQQHLVQLLGYYHQIALMVGHMHTQGYVHRDITARNVLIDDDLAYLTDFELAHRLGDDTPPYASGTFGYMAPEQRHNQQPSEAEDVYALGALLYHLISRRHPKALDRLDETQFDEHLTTLDAPEMLKMAIACCMAPNPESRWPLGLLISAIAPYLPTSKQQRQARLRKARGRIRRKLSYSGILAALAGLTVLALWLASDEPNDRDNGFTRNYLNQDLRPFLEYTVPDDVRYLAGQIGDSLHFSTLSPGEVLSLSRTSGQMARRFLIHDSELRRQLSTSNTLESNRFGLTLYDGNSRTIFEELPDGTTATHRVPELFTRAARLSETSIAMRKFKPGVRDQFLYRFDLLRDTALNETRITDSVDDGGLVTGGMLEFDTESGLGVYLTRYANRITLVDTNMRILSTGHTVDTFRHYTLKSQTVTGGAGSKITNAGPAYYVNKAVAIYSPLLFVNSYVKADNETADEFRESNVIDVYCANSLDTPRYVGSLRLQTEIKNRIRNFRVYGDTLTVLTPGKIRLYHLPFHTVRLSKNER